MAWFLSKVLEKVEIRSLEETVVKQASDGDTSAAWETLQKLRKAQEHQSEAAWALLRISDQQWFDPEDVADLLMEIAAVHADQPDLMALMAESLEAIRDIDDLNSEPPDHPVYDYAVDRLAALAQAQKSGKDEEPLLRALSGTARLMARQHDDLAEAAYRKLVELDPNDGTNHYNLGLFFKTRGRFQEGLEANQKALSLTVDDEEPCVWNLGICATGAGAAEAALEVWKGIGNKIEMGRFGLPDGGYPTCKVRLAERPLAERSAENDNPGQEETIWVERLSPCHGIIRSVLFYDELGVNYGDVVLFDGAPITFHKYGDDEVPVFPHMATLIRRNYQIYPFAGVQETARQLADVSVDLEGDALVYCHTESFREICSSCWRDLDVDHESHEVAEQHVVTGRIAAPADMAPGDVLAQLDKGLAARAPCKLYAPELCRAAGLAERADVEQRRFELLMGN
ncbi:MAG: prenyltransferase [Pseudomonadota bacterium]